MNQLNICLQKRWIHCLRVWIEQWYHIDWIWLWIRENKSIFLFSMYYTIFGILIIIIIIIEVNHMNSLMSKMRIQSVNQRCIMIYDENHQMIRSFLSKNPNITQKKKKPRIINHLHKTFKTTSRQYYSLILTSTTIFSACKQFYHASYAFKKPSSSI